MTTFPWNDALAVVMSGPEAYDSWKGALREELERVMGMVHPLIRRPRWVGGRCLTLLQDLTPKSEYACG
jgi:glutathione S-transferase